MIKSTCYRLMKNGRTGQTEYVETPSYLEIMKDQDGNEFRIHFHKVTNEAGYTDWSATEESTVLKCIARNQSTKKEAYEAMKEIIPKLKHILSKHTYQMDRMRIFKESIKK